MWLIQKVKGRLWQAWPRFWMRYAGLGLFGRIATRLAVLVAPPYKARYQLARLHSQGYIAPSAAIYHNQLRLGAHVFIGDRVVIFQHQGGGAVALGDRVHLNNDIIIEIGDGGSLTIGPDTYIQPRCQFTSAKAPIRIGANVQIAPNCVFYSYDHGIAPGMLISKQSLQTRGGIVIDDDAWLGAGVTVLDGVRIGKGAVIGAGAVVKQDIPDNAIAAGVPARVVKMRDDLAHYQAAP